MKFASAFLFVLPLALTTASAAITVESYSYSPSPSGYYPDNGGQLTDGIDLVPVWGIPNPPFSVDPLVGWQNTDFSITFHFASVETIGSVFVWAADSENVAGVYLPQAFTLRTTDNSFSRSFTVSNPAGSGSTVRFDLWGFSVQTDHLILDVVRGSQWTMLSEVTFAIPEPAHYAPLFGLFALLAPVIIRRRACKAARSV